MFFSCNFFSIFGHQNPGFRTWSVYGSALNQCGSTTLYKMLSIVRWACSCTSAARRWLRWWGAWPCRSRWRGCPSQAFSSRGTSTITSSPRLTCPSTQISPCRLLLRYQSLSVLPTPGNFPAVFLENAGKKFGRGFVRMLDFFGLIRRYGGLTPSKSNKQKNCVNKLVFCWHLEGQRRK